MEKFLIVGLGNIGNEYEHTRHNIGFDILNSIAAREQLSFMLDRHALYALWKFKGKYLHLIKPTTYMNLSGKAVRYWKEKFSLENEQILVLHDDLALPFGKLRLRKNGSAGGHNGLKSIEELLQTQNYARLKFGIGDDFPKGRQADYVLSRWNKSEQADLGDYIERSITAVETFVSIGIDRAMNVYNTKQ
ncbi:MAG: aminoacyl-tRNA hydrolase [Sphingobacteriales bacterium]|nr:aminoacyl-tRNA hydrolase [Sphingobacteriales bacterium]